MLCNALGIGQVKPDYRIAYVGGRTLPEDCVLAVQRALADLGDDVNGDGAVTVEISQYVVLDSTDPEHPSYSYAAEVAMLSDMAEGSSWFFLMDDPEAFQQSYQILAHTDGSLPADDDFEAMDKVYRWADCPALAGLELGTYTDEYLKVTCDCRELFSNLYLGIRSFYDPADAKNPESNMKFWETLTAGAEQ